MKQRQQGNTFVRLLVGLVILLISGVILAWTYYQNQQGIAPTRQPSTTAPTSSSTIPADWKTFTNQAYKYSFRYPPSGVVGSNDHGTQTEDTDCCTWLYVALKEPSTDNNVLSIRAYDSANYADSPELQKLINGPTEGFAQKFWQTNKDDDNPYLPNDKEKVGELTETSVAGETAYQFTVRGDLTFIEGGGQLVDQETTIVILGGPAGVKFLAIYWSATQEFQQALSSLQFTP
jgi:hypothetical protein